MQDIAYMSTVSKKLVLSLDLEDQSFIPSQSSTYFPNSESSHKLYLASTRAELTNQRAALRADMI